jgi:hypothetical protein
MKRKWVKKEKKILLTGFPLVDFFGGGKFFFFRCLASLHRSATVTPSLVALAARKVYKHRIVLVAAAEPARERSMQWGSELGAVAAVLHGVTSESVIDEVLSEVPVPV